MIATLQIAARRPLDILQHALVIAVVFACQVEVSLQVLLDDLVERCVLRAAAGIGRERIDIPVTRQPCWYPDGVKSQYRLNVQHSRHLLKLE